MLSFWSLSNMGSVWILPSDAVEQCLVLSLELASRLEWEVGGNLQGKPGLTFGCVDRFWNTT